MKETAQKQRRHGRASMATQMLPDFVGCSRAGYSKHVKVPFTAKEAFLSAIARQGA